jgi:glycosyltransferase involved in cell wall biosynthesis
VSDLPRLLLCCFDVIPAPTANSRRMTEYIKGLSDRYQVVVLTVKTPDHTHIERYHGARLLRVPVGSGDLAARVQAFDRAVRRQLDSEEYVMVHFFDPFGGYALCERRSDFGYKLVYDACSLPSVDLPFLVSEAEANRRFIAKVRRQELFCLMNADVVIVANELTRDFVAGLGVPREQVQVLPAPVDLALYDPKVMGVPDATPMKLLHLGNQSNAQDFSTLLEAMQLALQTVDVRLTILGPKVEEHQARLEEQVAALKLTGKVDFQPPVTHDDLHKVLAAADVGLLTLADVERNSRVGSPLSRLGEYLAAGRPVIAADVAAARALLPDDGVVLYRPQDKHSLADAIVSLATEPNRRVKLGAAARAASLDRDAPKIRADLVAIYMALSGTGVRAVGDADTTNPDEVTQLGASVAAEDTQKRKAAARERRTKGEAPSGTNKVKTDPAMVAETTSPEASTGADRPSVMGVPLHDEPPVVVGHDINEVAAEFAQVSTEPNARRSAEPPVVMGMPLAEAPKKAPPTYTPGDLAAELGEIEDSPSTGLAAPTAPVPDEPRHLDDAPTTGSHLSIVPRSSPLDDEPMVTSPARPPEPDPPPPSALSAIEEAARSSALESPAPAIPTLFPVAASSPTPPVSASASAENEPMPTVPMSSERETPAASAPTPLPPPRISAPQVLIPPLEMPPPLTASSPSGVSAAPPPLPKTPAPETVGVPLLTVPPLPPRSSSSVAMPVTKPTTSGQFPVVNAGPPALPRSSPSGTFATFSAGPPQLPKSSPSGTFAPFSPTQNPPQLPKSNVSGSFAIVPPQLPVPKSGSSGTFVPYTPPKSTVSGQFAVVPAPSAPLPKQATGLFPEPLSVPEKPEEIGENEIEQVGDAEGPLEVGADEIKEIDEIVEVPAPPPPLVDDSPVMASEESVTTVDTDASPPPSAINPWLAQLVHGYCPPESGLFERHTPPTTMPGRDT